jgi:hypothetical protein
MRRINYWVIFNLFGVVCFTYFCSKLWAPDGDKGLLGGPGDYLDALGLSDSAYLLHREQRVVRKNYSASSEERAKDAISVGGYRRRLGVCI